MNNRTLFTSPPTPLPRSLCSRERGVAFQHKSLIYKMLYVLSGIFFVAITSCSTQQPFDIIITNATIIDGNGQPGYKGDVAIRGDRIVKISKHIRGTAAETIDGSGRYLTPGFIDLHTHCDWGLDQPETRGNLNYLMQGTTSVVTGNCGYGTGKIDEFVQQFESGGIGTNMLPLTGFGWLRRQAMGNEDRPPLEVEMTKMKELFHEAIRQGTWGLSTGLQYVPEKYAATEEIIEITKTMTPPENIIGKHWKGFYTTHMRSEEDDLVPAVQEAIRIAKEGGVPLNIAHLKANGRKNWASMPEVIRLVEEAQKVGMTVTADMYPYDKSSTSPLYTVLLVPERLKAASVIDIQKALTNPIEREAIRQLTETGIRGQTNWVAKGGWNYFSIVHSPGNAALNNKMFIDLAEEQGTTPFDVAANLVIDQGEEIIISMSTMLEDNLVLQMKQPWVMFSSDGSAVAPNEKGVHPRNYGSQVRILRKYVREEGVLSLESGVFKLTGLPAKTIGLQERGIIVEGNYADLVIFDLAKVNDPATFLEPHRYAEGIDEVILNGKRVVKEGKFSGELAGRVLLRDERR